MRSPPSWPARRATRTSTLAIRLRAEAKEIVVKHGAFDTVRLRHVVEHVSDLDGFFAGIRTLQRDDGLLVLELPEVEESFRLGSPAILWEEHVNYFTPALAEHMLRRFGFEICDRCNYVFGGGSMAFVARKEALRSPARSSFPIQVRIIELLRRLAGGIERLKAELNGLVSLARLERLPGGGLRRRTSASSPVGLGLPDCRQDRLRDRRSTGTFQNRLMPRTPNSTARRGGRPHWRQAAVPAGRRLGEQFKVRAPDRRGEAFAGHRICQLFPAARYVVKR